MKKNKKRLIRWMHIFLFVFIILVVFCLIKCAVSKGRFVWTPKVCSGSICWKVEVANTPKTRETGLMHRRSLADDRGMLFVFDQSTIHGFWMKNTLIPLDMIRLDENLNIVYIQDAAQPCTADPCPTYTAGVPAKYVLELNGGSAKKIGLQQGDSLIYKK